MATGWPMKTTYANGDVFSASDVNDITGTINLASGAQWAAGKNKIINGDFRFNQRAFTSNTTTGSYNFDRFLQTNSGGTFTVTPQTFTAGTAPVTGYEAINFLRGITATQSAAGDYAYFSQRIEDVRTFANSTIVVSFWAKANTGTPKIGVELSQNFGSGGSPSTAVSTPLGSVTLSTSWARYSISIAVPSISGKTIGTTANTSYLELNLWTSSGATNATRASSIGIQNFTADIWGVQIEQGSTATAFQTASGSIGGELALCQRYYYLHASVNGDQIGVAWYNQATESTMHVKFPIAMRSAPTLSATSGASYYSVWVSNVNDLINSLTIFGSGVNAAGLYNTTESAGTPGTAGRLQNTSGFVAFVSEL